MKTKSVVACQMYPWSQRFGKRGQNWREHLDGILSILAATGYDAWDQSYPDENEAQAVKVLLDKHGLMARSQYVGGRWHEAATAPKALEQGKIAAEAGGSIGVKVVICNPEPIAWGKPFDKSDDEIKRQCDFFGQYGAWLAERGMTLAYHTHDPEMRQGAREFQHMMLRSNPAQVRFCLDTHWVYRGFGNSQMALDDVILAYGDRIAALHLRQSHGGVWTETLGEGDIDHGPLLAKLRETGFDGPIITECAIEEGTPATLEFVEAERASREWVRKIFGC
jgi:inosose dehydratase